jgi:hypothetical protein
MPLWIGVGNRPVPGVTGKNSGFEDWTKNQVKGEEGGGAQGKKKGQKDT